MFKNAIVGIDGRDGGREALALARALTAGPEALLLAHVRKVEPVPYAPATEGLESETREQTAELLEHERERAGLDGAHLVSLVGPSISSTLHSAAASRGCDLIVVGSCHRGPVGRLLIGDDARDTLHEAPCPVALAPRGYAPTTPHPRTIGVAYDGSATSHVALENARRLAHAMGATVKARRVIELTVHGAAGFAVPIVENEQEVIDRAREEMGTVEGVELDIAVGPTGQALASFSSEVDLLICGSRNQGPIKRLLLGSTSTYLTRHCHSPLLVTPAGG